MPSKSELQASLYQLLDRINDIVESLKSEGIPVEDKPVEIEFELEDVSRELSIDDIRKILSDTFKDYNISVSKSLKPNYYNIKILLK